MTEAIEAPIALNNPAARLRYWLLLGRRSAHEAAQDFETNVKYGNAATVPHRAQAAWCSIWDLDETSPADRVELSRRAVGLINAGATTRDLAERSSNDMADLALEDFEQVETCLTGFMELPHVEIVPMMGRIGDTGWKSLKLLDRMLGADDPEAFISDEETATLLDQTRALVDAVMGEASLTARDRDLILKRLREVEDALIRSHVTGTGDVERGMDGLMGTLVRVSLRTSAFAQSPVGLAVFGLIAALAHVLGVTADYSQIAGSGIGSMLQLPGG